MSEFAVFQPRPDGIQPLRAADGLVIRAACAEDADALGAISAAREGGDPDVHAAGFRRLVDRDPDAGLVLAAAVNDRVIGFGKVSAFTPPADAPPNAAPAGWYLGGVVVTPAFRRRGIGTVLTQERLRWIAWRAPVAYFIASAMNLVTIELHRPFGFVERTRDFWFPDVSFRGGVGILFEAPLDGGRPLAGGA